MTAAAAVVITGPSPSLWTTSMPYRIAVDPSDPGRHAYFAGIIPASAYLDRNSHMERVVELSPRLALAPSESHAADEPCGREPTAGNIASADECAGET